MSLVPPTASPRASADLALDSQAPTLTPPTANSSPRHEHATLPPEPASEAPAAPEPTSAPNPTDVAVTFLLISGDRKLMHFAPTMTFGRVKEAFWGAWTPGESESIDLALLLILAFVGRKRCGQAPRAIVSASATHGQDTIR